MRVRDKRNKKENRGEREQMNKLIERYGETEEGGG